MGDEGVHRKQHLRCGARLNRFPILQQAEGQVLDVAPHLLEWNEFPGHHRRPVERLGLFPRLAGGLECRLHVPRGEIEAKSDGRVTPASMLLPDPLGRPVHPHDHLHLEVAILRPLGNGKGVILVEDGALRLEEEQRLGWNGIAEFRSVLRIVPADADDFHEAKVTHAGGIPPQGQSTSSCTSTRRSKAPPHSGRLSPKWAEATRSGDTPRSRR